MKDPRLERAGDLIGSFILKSTELVGKNKVWDCFCICGNVKRFWKFSAISRQKTCGCGTDSSGLSSKQARSMKSRMQGYKNGAKKRNFEWLLSYDDFVNKLRDNKVLKHRSGENKVMHKGLEISGSGQRCLWIDNSTFEDIKTNNLPLDIPRSVN